jgi:hypothetical protein
MRMWIGFDIPSLRYHVPRRSRSFSKSCSTSAATRQMRRVNCQPPRAVRHQRLRLTRRSKAAFEPCLNRPPDSAFHRLLDKFPSDAPTPRILESVLAIQKAIEPLLSCRGRFHSSIRHKTDSKPFRLAFVHRVSDLFRDDVFSANHCDCSCILYA